MSFPSYRTVHPKPNLTLLSGLLITAAIASAAFALRLVPGLSTFSPAIIAAVTGLILSHTIKLSPSTDAGILFSTRTLLRLAVALLGVQVTVAQVAGLGIASFAIVAATLIASLVFIKALGRLLGVEPKLAELIAAGTSVCGAAAVAATNTVTEAADEDVAYGVAMVTIFGTIAMLLYPLADHVFSIEPRLYGLWAGASIHEVAQVVGATTQIGPVAAETGTIAKLTRVLLLAPLVMIIRFRGGNKTSGKVAVPLFVLGFACLVALGSVITIPAEIKSLTSQVSGFLLAMALGGMGLKTNIGDLKAKGWVPLVLGAAGTVFISLFSFTLIRLFA